MVNYWIQYDYYKNVLCENKDKPELKCNGTCHLAKELKPVENPAEAPTVPASLEIQQLLFANAESNQSIKIPLASEVHHSTNERLPSFLFVEKITEPPKV